MFPTRTRTQPTFSFKGQFKSKQYLIHDAALANDYSQIISRSVVHTCICVQKINLKSSNKWVEQHIRKKEAYKSNNQMT